MQNNRTLPSLPAHVLKGGLNHANLLVVCDVKQLLTNLMTDIDNWK